MTNFIRILEPIRKNQMKTLELKIKWLQLRTQEMVRPVGKKKKKRKGRISEMEEDNKKMLRLNPEKKL